MRRLRRLAVLSAVIGAVMAYRNRMLAANERRYADVLAPAGDGDPSSDGQQAAG